MTFGVVSAGGILAEWVPMPVRMELYQVIISEQQDAQIIVLRELDGDRKFPIVIGSNEAHAIDRRLRGIRPPRPQTHDLLASVIEALGGKVLKIEITRLEDHTFFASLYLQRSGSEEIVVVDSRPSDAIALGVASGVPIFVAEEVLDAAC